MIAAALDAHARTVLAGELERRRALLRSLSPSSRAAVERVAQQTLAGLTTAILEHAARDPELAAALESIYGPRRSNLAPAAAAAD
jgi:hypothetical protein